MKENKNEFLWGSATASYQCEGAWNEGGRGLSMWDTYTQELPQHRDERTGNIASDVYHHIEEDIRMMAEGNQNSYRFSIAWPRIFPKDNTQVNAEGVAFYHKVFALCKQYGLEPNVTLYHWDLPAYLADQGGWEEEETAFAFYEYAKFCFEEFKDEASLWVGINEPSYFTECGYAIGNYPPNVKNFQRYAKAAYHVMLASALGSIAFKETNSKGMYGIVHACNPVYPNSSSSACAKACRNADNYYNNWVYDTAVKGYFPQDMLDKMKESFSLDFMKEEHKEIFSKGTVDFLGINYYIRCVVKEYTSGESILKMNNSGKKAETDTIAIVKNWFHSIKSENAIYTDWDFEVYPEGLYDHLLDLKNRYGDIPFYITENGLGAYDELVDGTVEDDYRIDFLNQHIQVMLKTMEAGVDIRGYYAWSTMDVYSWINGYEKRYGLVYVDFEDEDRKRYKKKSYTWYQTWIQHWREERGVKK